MEQEIEFDEETDEGIEGTSKDNLLLKRKQSIIPEKKKKNTSESSSEKAGTEIDSEDELVSSRISKNSPFLTPETDTLFEDRKKFAQKKRYSMRRSTSLKQTVYKEA